MTAKVGRLRYLVGFLVVSVVFLGLFPAAIMANDDARLLAPYYSGIYDAPAAKIKKGWLSNEQFGLKSVTNVRPGESIYGCYVVNLPADAIITRTYTISKYSLSQIFSSSFFAGDTLFSWGFEIPDYKAKNNDSCTFYFQCDVTGGKSIKKSLNFKVLRDGIVNSTRAYEVPMDAGTKTKILNGCTATTNSLKGSPLKFNAHKVSKSSSYAAFIKDLKSWRPHAVLIHAHGNSDDGGRIYFPDDSHINAADMAASGFTTPAGLFYAAICEGATGDNLGNAFINCGYQAFIGYTVSVYTVRNADFYKTFFANATKPDVSVSTALASTIAWAQSQAWDDVATARIIGDGSVVFLGGKTGDGVAAVTQGEGEGAKVAIKVVGWKDAATSPLAASERMAVQLADGMEEVRDLKEKYGAALNTGIEEFPKVYRVGYKVNNKYIYGVDVDKVTGSIVFKGPLD